MKLALAGGDWLVDALARGALADQRDEDLHDVGVELGPGVVAQLLQGFGDGRAGR